MDVVITPSRGLEHLRLVTVQPRNAVGGQIGPDIRVKPRREIGKDSLPCRGSPGVYRQILNVIWFLIILLQINSLLAL